MIRPNATLPKLYTFRRCPYAMRARWAIQAAGVAVEKQEVALRSKPESMLAASPKGTVPVLVLPDGQVIDQSLDIMLWALGQNDPERWLVPVEGDMSYMLGLIDTCEREFKPHLDRYKYPVRYQAEWANATGATGNQSQAAAIVSQEHRFSENHFLAAQKYLIELSLQMGARPTLGGEVPALADFAIVPFVRQMARHDRKRFDQFAPAPIVQWMDRLLARPDFDVLMEKPGEKTE